MALYRKTGQEFLSPLNDCILWQGSKTAKGYARLQVRWLSNGSRSASKGTQYRLLAHRLLYGRSNKVRPKQHPVNLLEATDSYRPACIWYSTYKQTLEMFNFIVLYCLPKIFWWNFLKINYLWKHDPMWPQGS